MGDSSLSERRLPRGLMASILPKIDPRLGALLTLSDAALHERYKFERRRAASLPRRVRVGAIDRDGGAIPDEPDPDRYRRGKARPPRPLAPSTTGIVIGEDGRPRLRVLLKGELLKGMGDGRGALVQAGDLRLLELTPEEAIKLATQESTDRLELVRPVSPAVLDAREEIGLARAPGKTLAGAQGHTGKGVIIGIVDFGLDFYHSQLRHADGTSRVLGLWDQAAGRTYSKQDLDDDIASGKPYSVVPHRWHRQAGAGAESAGAIWMRHGTNMACIAAGGPHPLLAETNPDGSPGAQGCGIAPEADILFVSLDPLVDVASRDDLWGAAGFDQVLLGMQWILDKAKELSGEGPERPVVINLSLADYTGPHDGGSLQSAFLDELRSAPGRTVVAAAGNSAATGGHVHFDAGDTQDLLFEKLADADDALELWTETDAQGVVFQVDARAEPGGPVTTVKCGIGEAMTASLKDTGGAEVAILMATCTRRGGSVGFRMDVLMGDRPGIARNTRWQVSVSESADAPVHGWLEATNAGLRRWAMPSDDVTISDLASHPAFLTIGAVRNSYKAPHMPVLRGSGMGPTRDKRNKPDLVAPGATVRVVQPEDQQAVATYTDREYGVGLASGTSVASAITAGACAVVMQCRGVDDQAAMFSAGDLRVLLQSTADKDKLDAVDKAVPPGLALSPKSGHGVLDVGRACAGEAGRRDLWIQTSPADDGRLPRGSAVFWDSPDIHAVWDDEGATVTVRVRNRGDLRSPRARVRLGWATAISWLNVPGFSPIRTWLPGVFETFFAGFDRFLDEPPTWAIDGVDARGFGSDLGVVRGVEDGDPETATFRFTPPRRGLGPQNVQWIALVQGGGERVPRDAGPSATRFHNELAIQGVLPTERASDGSLRLYGAVHALGPSNAVSLRTDGGVAIDSVLVPAAALGITRGLGGARPRYRVISDALAADPLYQAVVAASDADRPLTGRDIGIEEVQKVLPVEGASPGVVALHLRPGVQRLDMGTLRLEDGSRMYIQVDGSGGGRDSRIHLIHLSSGDIVGGFSVRQADADA